MPEHESSRNARISIGKEREFRRMLHLPLALPTLVLLLRGPPRGPVFHLDLA